MSREISLLQNPIRVSTPFIKVIIGDYTFGVFKHSEDVKKDNNGVYKIHSFQYPNYVQSLKVVKINGKVNTYELTIKYPITESNDPNFFEKVFSSVSKSRKIVFTYGDLSAPKFMYKKEEALITNVNNSFDLSGSTITYIVSAVSSCALATAGGFNFVTSEYVGLHQPSSIIKRLLKNNSQFGLLDIFSGMKNMNLVESLGLIQSDDKIVELNAKTNINILDYLQYLVESMRKSSNESGIYKLVVMDDTSDVLSGPYFKVVSASASGDSLDTYSLDIGFPSDNVVTSFSINNNESFSILYNYSKSLNTNEYVTRIQDDGTEVKIYSPNISSTNDEQITYSNDATWWENVTQYPITASVTLKGLLRPAILMSKVRLNVLFYGKAHISSGQYIINKQVDTINGEGCWTTLSLVRIGGDKQNFKENV